MNNVLASCGIPRQPLEVLLYHTQKAEEDAIDFDESQPIDCSRYFVCPTLTPLYYTPIYQELDEDQQRRYNQLTGLCFNELIAFFETTFSASVLAALAEMRSRGVTSALLDCLSGFMADERKHIQWWHQLNLLSEPSHYATSEQRLIRFSPFAQKLLGSMTAHPRLFPVVFWCMLLLEERSMDISRRCLAMKRESIEPWYRLVHQHHVKDEARHVQMDLYLIDLFFTNRSRILRQLTAKFLSVMIGQFFLPPTRTARRVVQCLVRERPALAPLFPEMIRQLKRLCQSGDYHEMMYSRNTTPITFGMFDRFAEMHALQHVLRSYCPNNRRSTDEGRLQAH